MKKITPPSDLMPSNLTVSNLPPPFANAQVPALADPAPAKVSKVYQHWADGDAAMGSSAEWNNNILSDNKSDYFEGEVIPNMFFYQASNKTPLVNGQSYSFNITYNYYQGNTNAGGYAYMTTYNIDRQPGTLTGATPTADPVASGHNGGGMQGQFYSVNADVTDVSAVTYTSKGGSIDAHVTVTFTYTGTNTSSGGAEIYFGLMVAAPGMVPDQGKGMTDGAAAWTGGSLQTTVDVGGSGATSIQLAPSAIIAGEISGMKYEDVNGDGIREANGVDGIPGNADDEVGLSGWTIFLDTNHNGTLDAGERSTVTGAGGLYSFSVTPDADPLDPDNDPYLVREVMQAGWIHTSTDPAPITISALHPTAANVDFGNQRYLPALAIVKDASVPGGTADYAGEIVSYTIAVRNTGNQTLTGVTVTDPFISNLQLVVDDASSDGQLNVGETWHYTATHTVTQAEIDAGGMITNIATADSDQTGPSSDDAAVPVEQRPQLGVEKSVVGIDGGNNNSTADFAGDVIHYSVLVYNPGNQTLTGVSVMDPVTHLEVTGLTLAPGASQAYAASYTLTQSDLDTYGGGDGAIENTATADSDQTAPVSDSKVVPLQVRPSLSINKVLAGIDGGNGNALADQAGDVLHYRIHVVNEGTVTLTGLRVTDDLTHLDANGRTLAPGEDAYYDTSYVLQQADLDNNGGGDGYIDNIATADTDQTDPVSDGESVPLTRTIALGINKSLVNVTGGNNNGFADVPGDQLNFSIRVYNPGSVTLTGITLVDTQTGLSETLPSLAPGGTQTWTTHYTLTQADIDSNTTGYIDNLATADSVETDPVSDAESVMLVRYPVLAFDKGFVNVTGGNNNGIADAPGDILNYRFTVVNAGNLTQTGVTVSDPMTNFLVDGVTLAPGEFRTWTSSYTLTQADIDDNGKGDGHVDNTATARSDQSGLLSDSESVPIERSIALAFDEAFVEVTGGNDNSLADSAGDVLHFRFTATNAGTVTLTNVHVTDALTGLDATLAALAPGMSHEFTGTYVLQQSDLDGQGGGDGKLDNTSYASSIESGSTSDTESVTLVYDPRIDLTKYVSVDNGVTWLDANVPPGPELDSATGYNPLFRFVVTNLGNVTLPGVELTDSLYDLNGAEPGSAHLFGPLAVGDSAEWVFTGASFGLGLQSDVATAVVIGLAETIGDVDNVYYTGV